MVLNKGGLLEATKYFKLKGRFTFQQINNPKYVATTIMKWCTWKAQTKSNSLAPTWLHLLYVCEWRKNFKANELSQYNQVMINIMFSLDILQYLEFEVNTLIGKKNV